MLLSVLLLIAFPFAMIYAASTDLLTMRIENRVCLGLAAAFFLAAALSGMPWQAVGSHAAAGFLCLVVAFGLFAAGWIGGGDAKLLAATTLWFGPGQDLLQYLLFGALCGGGLTIALLAMRSHVMPATGVAFVDRLLERNTGVPYGIALGAAGLFVYTNSAWMDIAVRGLAS
ncbi:prepilin peptidase [Jiella sp. M17.18]|uniref:A24 family peptidase n=1 Tax=Jiella sp. M17.18 TaxID=3234247 RepID=UPI0034DE7CF2